jgi:hypothetical protein
MPAGNGNATIDNSTVFLDYLGPLGGSTVATWTNISANQAVQKAMALVQSAVRQGFMARVAADWQVSRRVCRTSSLNRLHKLAGPSLLCSFM